MEAKGRATSVPCLHLHLPPHPVVPVLQLVYRPLPLPEQHAQPQCLNHPVFLHLRLLRL